MRVDFEKRLEKVFWNNFSEAAQIKEVGAAVSVWRHGKELCHFFGGEKEQNVHPWEADTLVPVYSATKGPAAATVLLCLEESGMDGESLVERVWPKFPVAGATFSELLSHECGLAALDQKASIYDYKEVIRALEVQDPKWLPGEGHGYHPRTVGFLADEVVRRLTGQPLGEVWNNQVADPLGIDFFIGLDECYDDRVATLYPGRMNAGGTEEVFYQRFNEEGSLVRNAFFSPRGLHAVHEMNEVEAKRLALPAMGGVGSACGLAKAYQAILGCLEGSPFSPSIRHQLSHRRINGMDRILCNKTSYSTGMMMDPVSENGDKERFLFGSSKQAFGHAGAGGSHAFANPENGVSFAYVMNQMELSVLPGQRAQSLVKVLEYLE